MLEVENRDAGLAAALLGAACGALVAVDQREGARTAVASVYLSDSSSAGALRRVRQLVARHARDGVLRVHRVRDARVATCDWADEWKKHFGPLRLAPKLYVVPSWHGAFSPPSDSDALVLDPGMAFGTGRHATTRLAAQLMLERVRPGDVVIDAGCGSGILAMAALMRDARAFAFDNDPVAVRTAAANLGRNSLRPGAIVRASSVPSRFPPADIIVANIDAPALVAIVDDLAAKLKRGAALIASGVTARSRLELLATFANAGLRFVGEHRKGVWFAYVHEKP